MCVSFVASYLHFITGEVSVGVPDFKQRIVGAATIFSKTKSVVFYKINLTWINRSSKHFKPVSWVVEARFSSLSKLNDHLTTSYPLIDLPNFPEKFGLVSTVNSLSKDKEGLKQLLDYRKMALDMYFCGLISNDTLMRDTYLVQFLQIREHIKEASKAALAASRAAKKAALAEPEKAAPVATSTKTTTKKKKKAKPAEPEVVPDEAFDDPLAWMAGNSDED